MHTVSVSVCAMHGSMDPDSNKNHYLGVKPKNPQETRMW